MLASHKADHNSPGELETVSEPALRSIGRNYSFSILSVSLRESIFTFTVSVSLTSNHATYSVFLRISLCKKEVSVP